MAKQATESGGDQNRFRLTYRPVGNAKPTDEWRRIKTEQDAELTARNARAPAHRSDGKRTTKNRRPVTVCAKNQGGKPTPKIQTPVTESASPAMVRIPSLPLYSRVSVAQRSAPASKGEHVAPGRAPSRPRQARPGWDARGKRGGGVRTGRDDGIPEFLRRTPNGAASRIAPASLCQPGAPATPPAGSKWEGHGCRTMFQHSTAVLSDRQHARLS